MIGASGVDSSIVVAYLCHCFLESRPLSFHEPPPPQKKKKKNPVCFSQSGSFRLVTCFFHLQDDLANIRSLK